MDPSQQSQVPQEPQSWNRYAYVNNNPLQYVDPDGELKVRATIDINRVRRYELQWEASKWVVVGDALQRFPSKLLPHGLRGLRGVDGILRKLDELAKGPYLETESRFSGKWRNAAFESRLLGVFLAQEGPGLAGMSGLYSEEQIVALGRLAATIAGTLRAEGGLTESEYEYLVNAYDIARLLGLEESRSLGPSAIRRGKHRRSSNDSFAGTGFCDASNTCY